MPCTSSHMRHAGRRVQLLPQRRWTVNGRVANAIVQTDCRGVEVGPKLDSTGSFFADENLSLRVGGPHASVAEKLQ